MTDNAFYAQSGGVTSVINASAAGVIEEARQHPGQIGTVYAGMNGILGALNEELINTAQFGADALQSLRHTPAGAFGSCRYKLPPPGDDNREYLRLMEVFQAWKIRYFFYNGGGDSQDTADKLARFSRQQGYPITCIGVPKTMDNDLPETDCCPGFGSVAKYLATSIMEASLDLRSMQSSSTRVFIMEVMGRHAGWVAAASGLARDERQLGPDLILFPERPFEPQRFLQAVKDRIEKQGYCVVTASEGLRDAQGDFVSQLGGGDAFGHAQLGGVAALLAEQVQQQLGQKCRWAKCDYLQRAARHLASQTDLDQAYALGREAVRLALAGRNALMPTIRRLHDDPYVWELDSVPLDQVANRERLLPEHFIREDGFHITPAARRYLAPLIAGEAYPPYRDGLPDYRLFTERLLPKKRPPFERGGIQ